MTPPDTRARPGAEQRLEELLDRVRPVMAQTVDALQVAALLESDGITDEAARRDYEVADVFQLATRVRSRCVPTRPVVALVGEARHVATHRAVHGRVRTTRLGSAALHVAERTPDATAVRLTSHGLLYLLPVMLFPPVLALLGSGTVILGLVVGGGVAWVWAGAATWVAYQMLSARRPESAARALRLTSVGGWVVAGATGAVVAALTGEGVGLAAVVVAQMTYQMGATVLMFHHREAALLGAMVPAVLVGAFYLVTGVVSATAALVVGALCVLAVAATSIAGPRSVHDEPVRTAVTALRTEPGQFGLVVLYTALTAAYLLHAQMRYVQGATEVAIGLLPLIVAMGVVELRAFRFRSRAATLMRSVSYPHEFAAGIRRVLLSDIAVCAATVAGLGATLLVVLALRGSLSPAGVLMTVASIALASAYYLSFLMTGMGLLVQLCCAVALALGAHVVAVAVIPAAHTPVVDTAVFAVTATALLLVSLLGILPTVTDPRSHQ